MNNLEYRQSRGTDHPFTATKDEVRRAWYLLNKDKIDRRRQLEKRHGKKKNGVKFKHEDSED